MPSGIVKLGATLWFAAVADGHRGGAGGERLGVKNTALMKIKVVVWNGRIDEAEDFTLDLDLVCGHAPFVGGRGEHI